MEVWVNGSKEHPRPPVLRAMLTDVHFWLPVAVLVFGFGLLVFLRAQP